MSLLDITRALLATSTLTAIIYGWAVCSPSASWGKTALKTVPIGALALLSFVVQGPAFLTLALALSALGDLVLSRPGPRGFLGGLIAFALAHLSYLVLFIQAGASLETLQDPWRATCSILLIIGAFLLARRFASHAVNFALPVSIYAGLITSMGLAALALPSNEPAVLAIFGAGLFILSDMLLAEETFVAPIKSCTTARVLWGLYWLAQMVLLFAFTLAGQV